MIYQQTTNENKSYYL